jgi:hypothetical protein
MITVRPAMERGVTQLGWLDSRHSFSFDRYHDDNWMNFRSLRVINDDIVEAGQGFGTHPHRDMEIITYVLEGELAHKDSLGSGSSIRPGDVQRMTAGRGILHSEFNNSKTDRVRLLQIWILPEEKGLKPGYEQMTFTRDKMRGSLLLVASHEGRDSSVSIHQDVDLFSSVLESGNQVQHKLADGRYAWIQVATGDIEVNGVLLGYGDGAAISDESELAIQGKKEAEILLFDLA